MIKPEDKIDIRDTKAVKKFVANAKSDREKVFACMIMALNKAYYL